MAELKVLRTNKNESYKIIKLDCSNDPNLSWKAKGLHTYLISKPENWKAWRTDLYNKGTDGKDSVSSGIKELKENGYFYNYVITNEIGKIIENGYYILETSIKDKDLIKTHIDQWNEEDKKIKYRLIDYDKKSPKHPDSGKPGNQKTRSHNKNKDIINKNKDIDISRDISSSELPTEDSLTNNFNSSFAEENNDLETKRQSLENKDISPFLNLETKKQTFLPENENPARDGAVSLSSGNRTKEKPNQKYKRGFEFVDYWSEKPNLTSHKPSSKTYSNAAAKFCHLLAGTFGRYYSMDEKYNKTNNITFADSTKKWAPEEIREAIDRYSDLLDGKYGPVFSNNLPHSCDIFLYNSKTKRSIFLSKAGQGKEPRQYHEKPVDSDILSLYRLGLFDKEINATEEDELIRCVNWVIAREDEYRTKVEGVLNPEKIMDDKFFTMHIKYLSDIYVRGGFFQINYIKYRWKNYIMWLKKEYGELYDLDPTERFLYRKKAENEKETPFDLELKKMKEERRQKEEMWTNLDNRVLQGA